ncbi:MAG: hypothetical protein ABIH92_03875 [Nanoarchaeota archaeon]
MKKAQTRTWWVGAILAIVIIVLFFWYFGDRIWHRPTDVIPGYGDPSANRTPIEKLRYHIVKGDVQWYDSQNWVDFPDWNTLVPIGDKKITKGQARWYFSQHYYKTTESSMTNGPGISASSWKELYGDKVPDFTPSVKNLMEQTIEVKPLITSSAYQQNSFGEAIDVTLTVQDAYQRHLNEEIPADRLAASLQLLLSETNNCLFIFSEFAQPTGYKLENGQITQTLDTELFEEHDEFSFQKTTFTVNSQNVEYSHYYGTCPETIVSYSSDLPLLGGQECKVPFLVKLYFTKSPQQPGWVKAYFLAKYESDSEFSPTRYGGLELEPNGKMHFYEFGEARAGMTQVGCRIADHSTRTIPPSSQAYQELASLMIQWRDSPVQEPMCFCYNNDAKCELFEVEKKTNGQDVFLAVDLTKPKGNCQ